MILAFWAWGEDGGRGGKRQGLRRTEASRIGTNLKRPRSTGEPYFPYVSSCQPESHRADHFPTEGENGRTQ